MAKICLSHYDQYEEHSQQSRYFYGSLSIDKLCTYCNNVVEPEQQNDSECPHCGEVAGLIDMEN